MLLFQCAEVLKKLWGKGEMGHVPSFPANFDSRLLEISSCIFSNTLFGIHVWLRVVAKETLGLLDDALLNMPLTLTGLSSPFSVIIIEQANHNLKGGKCQFWKNHIFLMVYSMFLILFLKYFSHFLQFFDIKNLSIAPT